MNNDRSGYYKKIDAFYGNTKNRSRFAKLIDAHEGFAGKGAFQLFSAPGRTEIGGNHTDHNHGNVLAAAIDLDSIAAASGNGTEEIRVQSEGYGEPFLVDLSNLKPVSWEEGTSTALIRGIAARCRQLGYTVEGFTATISSDVLPGSGLSSSASFEVLVATIINHLFNHGVIVPVHIAKIGQYAENEYFGKPCGLMDQIACSRGGILKIDFQDPDAPVVETISFDLEKHGYAMLIVDTGGNHANLTADYVSVTTEMKTAASVLGYEYAREVTFDELLMNIGKIRESVGDRALLRLFHFVQENQRVNRQVDSLSADDIIGFLNLVNESGNSSYKYLQNCYTTKNVSEQGVSLALALSEEFIREKGGGACRVHGGGFAGTIQAFISKRDVDEYVSLLSGVFGRSSVQIIKLREAGASTI